MQDVERNTNIVLALVGLLVVAVAIFSRMKKPAWLDRLWLWAIGISFAIYVPIWLAMKAQQFGWTNVLLALLALFLAGMYQGWPTDPPRPRPGSK